MTEQELENEMGVALKLNRLSKTCRNAIVGIAKAYAASENAAKDAEIAKLKAEIERLRDGTKAFIDELESAYSRFTSVTDFDHEIDSIVAYHKQSILSPADGDGKPNRRESE